MRRKKRQKPPDLLAPMNELASATESTGLLPAMDAAAETAPAPALEETRRIRENAREKDIHRV